MSSSTGLNAMVLALKSAAEPTRLRLLALLSHGELSVGEICRVLGQSQPRVSRHLRLLAEAGFLDRFREQQCIYYRTPARLAGFGWLRQLLEQVDASEPVLKRDRERVSQVILARARAASSELRRGQPGGVNSDSTPVELGAALLEELGPTSVGELLDIGTGSGGMMELLARRARHAVGIDISAPALRMARTRVHGAGLSHCEFHRGDMYELPCEDASFDTVSMDRLLALAKRPAAALAEAARALRPGGRLIIVERFDQMEAAGSEHPLRQLRSWLAGAGLDAARLRPCDFHEGHYLIATARRSASQGS
jgi:ArsR family transcriptional regulator